MVSYPCMHARLTKCCPITIARNPPDAELPVSADTKFIELHFHRTIQRFWRKLEMAIGFERLWKGTVADEILAAMWRPQYRSLLLGECSSETGEPLLQLSFYFILHFQRDLILATCCRLHNPYCIVQRYCMILLLRPSGPNVSTVEQ